MPDRLTATDVELFGSILAFTQQLTDRMEEQLAPFGLTSRQWLLLAMLTTRFPDRAPTLSEATAAFGTSRQNVKQIAQQLARRGWLRMEADTTDRRAVRLVLTERISVFEKPAVRDAQAAFVHRVFGGLTEQERRSMLGMVTTCLARVSELAPDSGAPR